MACRTKSLLLLCVLFCVGLVLIQEYVYSSLDNKHHGLSSFHNRRIPTWPIKLSVVNQEPSLSHPHGAGALFDEQTLPNYTKADTGSDRYANVSERTAGWNSNNAVPFSNNEFTGRDVTGPITTAVDIEAEHERRIRELQETCEDSADMRQAEVEKANGHMEFFYSRRHDFAYCKVPKSGSTFWMHVFMILTRGGDVSKLISRMSRAEIHDRSRRFMMDPKKIVREHIRTVVVSRNPYTRLFSAYVDKVYLPLFWEHFATLEGTKLLQETFITSVKDVLRTSKGEMIGGERVLRFRDKLRQHGLLVRKNITIKIKPICANDATFEQFLKFIIDQVKLKKPLEAHWAPISHLCHPCRLNTFKVVKQESFSADVEHTLTTVGMNLSKYEWLKNSLNENRAVSSIPGIVAVVGVRLRQKAVEACISQSEVAQRLWKAFQIQGFISDQSEVPDVFKKANFRFYKEHVTNEILKAVSAKPLTLSEQADQRHRHLQEAFSGVDNNILQEIQEIYKLDFTLFDYSTLPPL